MRKSCNAENCNKVRSSGGFCFNHSDFRTDKICKEDSCSLGYYSNGYCKKHNEYHRRNPKERVRNADGSLRSKECLALGCKKNVLRLDYCQRHQRKFEKYGNANIDLSGCTKGKKNVNWAGGVAEYPNHYTMKLLRKEKLEIVGNHCQECGIEKSSSKLDLHHLDGSKDNHSMDNVLLLCHKCHMGIYHSGARGSRKRSLTASKGKV